MRAPALLSRKLSVFILNILTMSMVLLSLQRVKILNTKKVNGSIVYEFMMHISGNFHDRIVTIVLCLKEIVLPINYIPIIFTYKLQQLFLSLICVHYHVILYWHGEEKYPGSLHGLGLTPFPKKLWLLRVCSTSPLKTLWEKEKLLILSNFPFSYSVFYPSRELWQASLGFYVSSLQVCWKHCGKRGNCS